ncbi:MAG: DNA repair protein RecO [Pyrinomonadaceae bacterium]
MALVETESLILKSYSLAEADKIIVCLTRAQGLVRGVAKGAKRLKSRFGGSLEPFTIVDLTFYQKEERELVSIRQIEMKKSFFEQASNPNFLQKFSYLTDILIDFAPPHEPNERLYRMAKACLEAAAENPQSLDSIVLYFEIWLLRLAGYLPFWGKCDNCQRELTATETANLQINFHLLCQNCRKSRSGIIVAPEERQIFMLSQTVSPAKFIEITSGKIERVRAVSGALKKIIAHILGKETVGERVLVAANL